MIKLITLPHGLFWYGELPGGRTFTCSGSFPEPIAQACFNRALADVNHLIHCQQVHAQARLN
jgi:hypothetical protein